ncbi:DnaD domain protein [Furfurilactobacillus curtus]|uniref:Helicase DnaB n=1 Tax=Furfurilactobacillus curtus TaxID=1746200 RepID=A0ABQ5JPR8_9LACO
MADTLPTLTPRAGFIVINPSRAQLTTNVWQRLYQPILGNNAFGLYNALQTFISEQPQLSNRRVHSQLLSWTDLDLPHFQASRQRLEALGLLNSYYQQDALGDLYIYELHQPLDAQTFFRDDLLSVLLFQYVGQARYTELIDYFNASHLDLGHFKNISADFLSVYHVGEQQLAQRPAQSVDSTQSVQQPRADEAASLDFHLLGEYLKRESVDLTSVDSAQDLLQAEALLYGLNERELANLVVKATSVTTNRFDPDRFRAMVVDQFQQQRTQIASVPSSASSQTDAQVAPVRPQGTDELHAILAAVKAYAPADFLAVLKQEKNQYVTSGEQRVLSTFMQRQLFAPSVVNMLIYYLIADRDQNVLYQNSVDRVANDWAKAKVQTPEQAVKHMQAFAQAQATRQQNRSGNRPTKSREQLPDWNQTASSSANSDGKAADEIAQLRQRLSKAKESQEDRS